MTDKLLAALRRLDPEDDSHWTSVDTPNMKAVETFYGDKSIKRKDVTDAAPLYTRHRARLGIDPANRDPNAVAEKETELDKLEVEPAAEEKEAEVAQEVQAEDLEKPELTGDGTVAAPEVEAPAEPEVDAGPRLAAEPVEDDKPDVVDEVDDAEKRAAMSAELSAVNVSLEAAIVAENKAIDERKRLEAERDRLETALYIPSEQTFATTIQGFLQSQQRIREGRGDNRQVLKALKEAGVLKAHSPIDAAMARDTARGKARPEYHRKG